MVESLGNCFFSAVRTDDKAATAAARCDPWLVLPGFGIETGLGIDDELNAEFRAARADALWVGPPLLKPFDFSCIGNWLSLVSFVGSIYIMHG